MSLFPPSYEETTNQHSSSGDGLTFVDFPPRYVDDGTRVPRYDTFVCLMQRANTWLSTRPHVEVKTCESYEMKSGKGVLDKESMIYHEPGTSSTYCYRGLRLWLVPRKDRSRPAQQLGFMNVVPKMLRANGENSEVENLDQMVQRFNVTSKVNPVPGRVLTIESQDILTSNYSILDPNVSYFEENSQFSRHYLIILRIFYEFGESKMEEIGLLDFVPTKATSKAKSPVPSDFEPFSFVVHRASRWCSEQHNIRYCNAQSLELKLRNGSLVDTKRMAYTEHSGATTNYIRILRVAYVKLPPNDTESSLVPTLELSCKTFVPYQASSGVLEFDSLTQTRRHVEAWCKETKARVVSCETSAMRLKTGGEASLGVDASFTYNISAYDEYWIYVIRLYLDGVFIEPPCMRRMSTRSFQPPIVEEESCCVII